MHLSMLGARGGGRAMRGYLIADVVFNVGNLLARESPRWGSFECRGYKVGEGRAFDQRRFRKNRGI